MHQETQPLVKACVQLAPEALPVIDEVDEGALALPGHFMLKLALYFDLFIRGERSGRY